jgi:uncharacterized membrane protein YjjB (DUF3815 family)
MIIQVSVAFFATLSFSILFHVPKQQYLYCGFTGAAGWLCYLLVNSYSHSVVWASFIAAVALTLVSRIFAVFRKMPVTVFLICGIFPLVPGAGIYYTAYHIIMNENSMALIKGMETIKIAVAIALGIVLVLSLPYFFFKKFSTTGRHINRHKSKG